MTTEDAIRNFKQYQKSVVKKRTQDSYRKLLECIRQDFRCLLYHREESCRATREELNVRISPHDLRDEVFGKI
jgi:hypothetical protein